MAINWYLIPKSEVKDNAEIGNYGVSGNLTNFSRGLFIANYHRGLVTGLESRAEAELWRDKGKYDLEADRWVVVPSREDCLKANEVAGHL